MGLSGLSAGALASYKELSLGMYRRFLRQIRQHPRQRVKEALGVEVRREFQGLGPPPPFTPPIKEDNINNNNNKGNNKGGNNNNAKFTGANAKGSNQKGKASGKQEKNARSNPTGSASSTPWVPTRFPVDDADAARTLARSMLAGPYTRCFFLAFDFSSTSA